MNIIFLTLIDVTDINERGIYQDLLRKFRDEGHNVFIIAPAERRKKVATQIFVRDGITLLKVRTLNIQKTNVVEKGIGTILLEHQFLHSFKKYFSDINFNLVLYSTPPITLTRVIQYIKQKDSAISYLLLKDIFPQNAVDLGMMKKGGMLYRFFRKKEKQLYAISDYIGCMSPANVDFIRKHNREVPVQKIEVNPNSIALLKNSNAVVDKNIVRGKYGIPGDVVVYIYGGNLGKPQGIDFLVAVLESNRPNRDVFFVIVGGGTEYRVLENWYKNTQPLNTLLLQSLPKKDYDELVKACDVGLIFLDKRFTIPNFPSRLLSYLEYRMPVLAATDKNTDIGKIVEEAGAGFWTEAGNLHKFNELLLRMAENRELMLKMGKNAYELLINSYKVDFSYDAIVKKVT